MFADERTRRQQLLNDAIRDMAANKFNDETTDEIVAALNKLQDIYRGNFYHNYSSFFPLILELSREYDLDGLTNNLESLQLFLDQDYLDGTKRYSEWLFHPVRKLCDHLNLEISRLNYYASNESKIDLAEQKANDLSASTKEAIRSLNIATRKTKSIQNEMIAVLSIFAAVVMAFFGGINFISSAIASLETSHIFKSAAIVLVAGTVVFNTIFLLLYTIAKIVDRDILVTCESVACSCQKKCAAIKRLRKRVPAVYWVNLLFLGLLAINSFAWLCAKAPIT